MRYTKSVIVAVIGIFIMTYVMLIGTNIYIVQSHKNVLEKHVSRVVENTLEDAYESKDKESALKRLRDEILENREERVSLNIKAIDLEKGILSVEVRERVKLITGSDREIFVEKTAILERVELVDTMVKVTFMVDGEIYKEYHLEKGESCPLPKEPSGLFGGWIEYGGEAMTPIQEVGEVWEDKIYLAITK